MKDRFYASWLALATVLIVMIAFDGWSRVELFKQGYEIAEIQQGLEEVQQDVEELKASYKLSEPIKDKLLPEEMYLVALVCYTEDRQHGMEGLKAVAQTIFNRLEDGRFGNSISDICTPTQFYGLKGNLNLTVSDEALNAVREVFEGEKIHDGLYFCTPATNPNEIKRGLIKTAVIGGHVYYKEGL